MIEQENSAETRTKRYMFFMSKIMGFFVSKAIFAVAKLGVADVLVSGPKTADEIAAQVGADPQVLFRTMRLLVSEGVFDQDDDGRYTLGPLGDLLISDQPDSIRWWALNCGDEQYRAWVDFLEVVKTGQPAFEGIYGETFFDYLQHTPEAADIFNRAMGTEGPREQHLAEAYDYAQFDTIVDVGGGYGKVLQAILARYPQVKGIVYDLPASITGLQERIVANGLQDRLSGQVGNFFERVPAGGDAYLLSLIIHDWSDEKASLILRNCFEAMQPGHKLLIAEQVLGADKLPSLGKRLDLNMLVMFGGRERTEEEYRVLLDRTGFTLTQIVPTRSRLSIVEAVRR